MEKISSSNEDEEYKDVDTFLENHPDTLEFVYEEVSEETQEEIDESSLTQIISSISTTINAPLDSSTKKGKEFLSSLTWNTRDHTVIKKNDFNSKTSSLTSNAIKSIKSPLDLIFFILNVEFWKSIAEQTNLFAAQFKQTVLKNGEKIKEFLASINSRANQIVWITFNAYAKAYLYRNKISM
ncbi:hypothetical protein BB559_002720 [Furculomyces boomerangus]|uniref:Uncharacterized protein n=2 Tax=Harpellales TaxID=61421 RepID=A0A2T9YT06_9FUNG|nr:hypothetical protein BB559_002720 [Furculomyces boomerangus]PWA02725.1 hypothetical protein BB558_001132 [Smittium angustum]